MEQSNPFKSVYGEEVYSIPTPVTVIIGISWNDIKEEQRVLLSKILQAVRLSLESVRIVEMTPFDLSAMIEKPSKVLAFLAPPKGLASYEVVQTGDTSIIFSDPLDILMTDDAAKRKLWNTLKSLFSA
ncbi:MAG: hypothetical protein HOP08_16640 [Cyclobacteriaceae bacterium]|nr:hypothetical protein [Cyclobacteriaceae bacterium]